MGGINDKREYIRNEYSQKSKLDDRFFKPKSGELCFKSGAFKIVERDEFARDKDRIIFTRAFRRLVHKAQVYTHHKGEHFRNRLTHSLEVAQISCSIARNLGLNENLTEAIALGHDIGHTPFGHAGERILNEIISGQNDLDGLIVHNINYGGFKHNFQGLKTLDILERKYETIPGLNLTWQVKDGILKHTRVQKSICDSSSCYCGNCWDLSRFMRDINEFNDLKFNFPCTLEGQIVAVADEITQREHDLDDGLRDNEIKDFVYTGVITEITSFIDKIKVEFPDEDPKLLRFLLDLKHKLDSRNIKDEDKDVKKRICRRDALIRDIIEYFILDVTYNSLNNIYNDQGKNLVNLGNKRYVKTILVDFSVLGKMMSDRIEDYIISNVLRSKVVKVFDDTAETKIQWLFEVYYSDPRKLTDYAVFRLNERIKHNYNKIYKLEFKDSVPINKFDFEDENIDKIIKILKLEDLNELKSEKEWDLNLSNLNIKNLTDIIIKPYHKFDDDKDKFLKCLLENNYAYLSAISDFLSAMADNYVDRKLKDFLNIGCF